MLDNIGSWVKEADEGLGKDDNGDNEHNGKDRRYEQRGSDALLGSFNLVDAEILPDKGRRSKRDALHRQQQELVYL